MTRRSMPLLLCALMFACLCGAASAEPVSQSVVLISVDGLAWYYFDDPKAEMPTIRQLAAEGARAVRMKAVLPTVTWPNHTTLVTGVSPARHGVIGNSYWGRAEGKVVPLIPDPLFNKDQIVKVPTVYDVAHEAGMKTAGIIWPASRGASTLDWTVPDCMTQALWNEFGTKSLMDECRALGIPVDSQEKFCKTGQGMARDQMYTDMLIHTLKTHKPALSLLHLVEVDHVEHAHGPRSPEAYAAVKFEDERIKQIKETLDAEFPGRATLIITSDHGFIAYAQTIQPNVVLKGAGLLKADGGTITDRTVFALGQGGASFIYVLDKANREALVKKAAAMFRGIEGVDLVIEPTDFAAHGLADPDKDPHAADLVITAKDGYSFSDSATGDAAVTSPAAIKGAHGHSPTQPDMYASFVAWGAGIKKGVKLEAINNTDVAPTAASILGLKMKNVEGRVLTELRTD